MAATVSCWFYICRTICEIQKKSPEEGDMKFKLQKINFLVLFLLFLSFAIQIFQNTGENYVIFFVYMFLSTAIFDLSFEAKKDETLQPRQICWILLNLLTGILLGYDTFCKKNLLLFLCITFWTLFCTFANFILLFKKTRKKDLDNLE